MFCSVRVDEVLRVSCKQARSCRQRSVPNIVRVEICAKDVIFLTPEVGSSQFIDSLHDRLELEATCWDGDDISVFHGLGATLVLQSVNGNGVNTECILSIEKIDGSSVRLTSSTSKRLCRLAGLNVSSVNVVRSEEDSGHGVNALVKKEVSWISVLTHSNTNLCECCKIVHHSVLSDTSAPNML